MAKFSEIKSPLALAAVGAFLVPEPVGSCLVAAAFVWWLGRKSGLLLQLLSRLAWLRAARPRLTRLRVAFRSPLKLEITSANAVSMVDIETHPALNQVRTRDLM